MGEEVYLRRALEAEDVAGLAEVLRYLTEPGHKKLRDQWEEYALSLHRVAKAKQDADADRLAKTSLQVAQESHATAKENFKLDWRIFWLTVAGLLAALFSLALQIFRK